MQEARFPIELREDPGQPFAELDITVSDNKVGEYLTQEIRLPIDRSGGLKDLRGKYQNPRPLALYAAPNAKATVLAHLAQTHTLEIDGQLDGYARVLLPQDKLAFAKLSDLEAGAGAPALGSSHIEWNYAISPPRVTVTKLPTQTEAKQVRVRGEVYSEDQARDLYITVYNPARDPFGRPQKVYYLANPDPQSGSFNFETTLPLQPGNNLIEVFARGRGDIIGWSRHWVLSTEGLDEARAQDAAAQRSSNP